MQQTIFSLLTNEESRNADAIQINLDQEATASKPWFDRVFDVSLNT